MRFVLHIWSLVLHLILRPDVALADLDESTVASHHGHCLADIVPRRQRVQHHVHASITHQQTHLLAKHILVASPAQIRHAE